MAHNKQSDWPPKISTLIQFSSSAMEIENNIRIHRTFPTKPQDDNQNEWIKLQSNRKLHQRIEFFNLTSSRASENGSSQA